MEERCEYGMEPPPEEDEISFEELLRRSEAQEHYQQGLEKAAAAGDAAAGLAGFARALELDPGNPLHVMDCALALNQAGQHTRARALAAGARGLLPATAEQLADGADNPYILHRMGLLHSLVLDDEPAALPFYTAAHRLLPDFTPFTVDLAVCLRRCGHDTEALQLAAAAGEELYRAGELAPDDAEHLARLAHVVAEDDPVLGQRLAGRALDAAGDDPNLLRDAGVVALLAGDDQAALERFRRACELAPDWDMPRGGLQAAMLGLGMFQEAAELGFETLARWPEFDEVRFNTAAALLNSGRHDEARGEFEQCLNRDAGDAMAHASLGVCLALQGRADEARQEQARALQLAPDDTQVRQVCDEIDRILDGGDGSAAAGPAGRLLLLALLSTLGRRTGRRR